MTTLHTDNVRMRECFKVENNSAKLSVAYQQCVVVVLLFIAQHFLIGFMTVLLLVSPVSHFHFNCNILQRSPWIMLHMQHSIEYVLVDNPAAGYTKKTSH